MAKKKEKKQVEKKEIKKDKKVEVTETRSEDGLRVVPFKNYVYIAIIFLVVVGLVFGLRSWYQSYQSYQLTVPVLKGKISQVTKEELESYLQENSQTFIYVEITSDANARKVAKKLPNVLSERNIMEHTILVSLKDKKELKEFLNEFNEKYNDKDDIKKAPAFIIMENGKVKDYVSRSNQVLLIGDVVQKLDEYEIEG